MKKIDTTYWKEFRVGDLFDIKGGKGITKQEIYEHPGDLPAIQSGEENFGCIGYLNIEYCKAKKYIISKGECLTVARSGSSGYVGYQASQCVVGDSAKILEPKFEANTLRLLFLRSALMVLKAKFAYTDKVTNENYTKVTLLLPSKDGVPNWQFMEEYMRHIEQRVQSSISAIRDVQNNRLKIDHSNWKMFDLKRLFDIVLSKGDIQAKKMKEGDIPLVSSGKFNNGICKYIAEGDGKAEMFDANVITTDMFGKSYFQDKPFYAVSHGRVNILLPLFKINSYIAKFLVSVLDASFLSKYSFSGMCCQKELQKEKILLPAKGYEPDWHYMEMYMRGVEAIVKNKLSLLVPHKPELTIQDAASITFNNANVTYIDNSKNYSLEK